MALTSNDLKSVIEILKKIFRKDDIDLFSKLHSEEIIDQENKVKLDEIVNYLEKLPIKFEKKDLTTKANNISKVSKKIMEAMWNKSIELIEPFKKFSLEEKFEITFEKCTNNLIIEDFLNLGKKLNSESFLIPLYLKIEENEETLKKDKDLMALTSNDLKSVIEILKKIFRKDDIDLFFKLHSEVINQKGKIDKENKVKLGEIVNYLEKLPIKFEKKDLTKKSNDISSFSRKIMKAMWNKSIELIEPFKKFSLEEKFEITFEKCTNNLIIEDFLNLGKKLNSESFLILLYLKIEENEETLKKDKELIKKINDDIDIIKGIIKRKENLSEILKLLKQIGDNFFKLTWNNNQKNLIRNRHGLKNGSNKNQSNTNGAKIDFEILVHLNKLESWYTTDRISDEAFIQNINKSIDVLKNKVNIILKEDETKNETNDETNDEEIEFLYEFCCYINDIDSIEFILNELITFLKDLDLNRFDFTERDERYLCGSYLIRIGECSNKLTIKIKEKKYLKKLFKHLNNFRNFIAKTHCLNDKNDSKLSEIVTILMKNSNDLKEILQNLQETIRRESFKRDKFIHSFSLDPLLEEEIENLVKIFDSIEYTNPPHYDVNKITDEFKYFESLLNKTNDNQILRKFSTSFLIVAECLKKFIVKKTNENINYGCYFHNLRWFQDWGKAKKKRNELIHSKNLDLGNDDLLQIKNCVSVWFLDFYFFLKIEKDNPNQDNDLKILEKIFFLAKRQILQKNAIEEYKKIDFSQINNDLIKFQIYSLILDCLTSIKPIKDEYKPVINDIFSEYKILFKNIEQGNNEIIKLDYESIQCRMHFNRDEFEESFKCGIKMIEIINQIKDRYFSDYVEDNLFFALNQITKCFGNKKLGSDLEKIGLSINENIVNRFSHLFESKLHLRFLSIIEQVTNYFIDKLNIIKAEIYYKKYENYLKKNEYHLKSNEGQYFEKFESDILKLRIKIAFSKYLLDFENKDDSKNVFKQSIEKMKKLSLYKEGFFISHEFILYKIYLDVPLEEKELDEIKKLLTVNRQEFQNFCERDFSKSLSNSHNDLIDKYILLGNNLIYAVYRELNSTDQKKNESNIQIIEYSIKTYFLIEFNLQNETQDKKKLNEQMNNIFSFIQSIFQRNDISTEYSQFIDNLIKDARNTNQAENLNNHMNNIISANSSDENINDLIIFCCKKLKI